MRFERRPSRYHECESIFYQALMRDLPHSRRILLSDTTALSKQEAIVNGDVTVRSGPEH